MTVSALRYLHTPSNELRAVPVHSLHDAQEIVAGLDHAQVSGVRISYFSEYHGCEVVTHRLIDGEFITTRKRI